jgi:hypothetical protein
MQPLIRDHFKSLELGNGTTYQNMTVYPVVAETDSATDHFSLDEALEKHLIEITEVSESGDVPNLKVKNRAEIAILILAGEELVGAKQNRIINATFLIGGGRSVTIPVSCVEQAAGIIGVNMLAVKKEWDPRTCAKGCMKMCAIVLAKGLVSEPIKAGCGMKLRKNLPE